MSYMKDLSGRRLDSFKVSERTKSARLGAWHRLLDEATLDSHVLALGDSTGSGLTRFVRLLADRIAAQYPAHTVIYAPWDDTSKTYPAGSKVTVQTGSNGRTITVWNGSFSGSVIGYARDNVVTLTSGVSPQVILVNYGHNSPQLTGQYRAIHQETVQLYSNRFPDAAVVLITQNPRATTDSAYADDEGKQRAVYGLAAAWGYDLVDVNKAFREYPNYASVLLDVDGLHPSTAGSVYWADLVWDALDPSRVEQLAGLQGVSSRVWVPANLFEIAQGTPTLAVVHGVPTWALDATAVESVVATVDIPSSWVYQNIRAIWTTTTGTGAPANVQWSGDHMYVGGRSGYGGSIDLGTFSASGGVQSTASTVTGRTVVADVWARVTLGQAPVALRVGRNGAHANDTLPQDALFIGIIIDRAY